MKNGNVPANVQRIIREKGLRQKAVADKAGYSAQQFSSMMNNRKIIKPVDLVTISKALEVPVGELFQH